MRRSPISLYLAATAALTSAACLAQVQREPPRAASTPGDSVRSFLRSYLNGRSSVEDKTTRFSVAFVQLNGSRASEMIVYVTGQSWCGSGGCLTLILAREDSSYRVVTRIPITRPPIRVLRSTSNGWHDIGVWVQGGGIQPGYEAQLQFDGKTYPSNPTVPPAKPLKGKVSGEIALSSAQEAMPLYP